VSAPTDRAQVEFLAHLQRLLTEGGFTASYKFALLLALADIAVEMGNDSGDPLHVPLGAIAEHLIRLYWRQVVLHPTGHILQQNTGKQAAIVNLVQHAHKQYVALPILMRNRRAWMALTGRVAAVAKAMPLFKLQTLGAEKLEFLYPNEFVNGGITLREGVCFCLRRFHPLIEDLVRGAWVRFVRTLPANHAVVGEKTDLVAFMFGAGRNDLSAVAPILFEAQSGQCFYCDGQIRETKIAVDHFIPWARYPADLAHNFVLADEGCNGAKSDMLAASPHLQRWSERNRTIGSELGRRFDDHGLLHDVAASDRITWWAYENAERAQTQVWIAKKELVRLGSEWRSAFDRSRSAQ
jgi:5-methylcytosine-specific restriction endonuclease McrA